MKSIQIDMYSVGLGAALLLQFRRADGSIIRILADGGMGPGGYPLDGVRDRLPSAVSEFSSGEATKRIDFIVGTHYDADHLKGLLPIASDESFEIGDVWLPPVKDDTEEAPGHISDSKSFLVDRFFEDSGSKFLKRYLTAKLEEVQSAADASRLAAQQAAEALGPNTDKEPALPFYSHIATDRTAQVAKRVEEFEADDFLRVFEEHQAESAALTGTGSCHDSAAYDSSQPDLRSDIPFAVRQAFVRVRDIDPRFLSPPTLAHARLRVLPGALSEIRKSEAGNAITAIHLHKLVQALRNRSTPVRPRCQYIDSGKPMRFVWSGDKKRFVARARTSRSDVALTLLGPSASLIAKHRSKLPVGSYKAFLMSYQGRIGRESITASNQLSYIFVVEADRQRILVSGDAGCYDFRSASDEYYGQLLSAMRPLHVVQVAHHAGHNYDFYNVLLEAGFASQRPKSFLLVSHDVEDPKRPSDAFRRFIEKIRQERDSVSLLFTSKPLASQVADYDDLIAAPVPRGGAMDRGDVRLVFPHTASRRQWKVERHAIDAS